MKSLKWIEHFCSNPATEGLSVSQHTSAKQSHAMGADSSTLQSIESLNSTLEDIEKKLFVIEDVHLHHERTISHDDSVLISGKKIGCRSGVRLLCGPVLGVIGSNWARILVEVDTDAELSFNVFATDGNLLCSRYMFSATLFASKGVPISTKIEGLEAGTNYSVYIGGIVASETVTNYASFQTIPEEASAVRIVLAHNGRVDRLMPGETNLWKEIEHRVTAPQTSMPGYIASAPIDTDVEDAQLYLPYADEPTAPRVHLLCHHGNLISIEPIIRSRAMELLDLLVREDSNYEDWTNILEQTEAQIKTAFRNALTSPSLCQILRKCGNVFLIGAEEAGAITTAMLALNLPEKLAYRPPVDPEEAPYPSTPGSNMGSLETGLEGSMDEADGDSDVTSTKGGASMKSGKSGPSGKRGSAKVKKGKSKKNLKAQPVITAETIADDARRLLIPVPESAEDPGGPDKIGDVDLTPVVGTAVRRFYDAGQLAVKSKTIVQENLRRLLAGLLVRSYRRISRSYLRQLWDDDYAALATEDAEKEIFFRSMLRLQKVLQVKTHLRTILESSRIRLSKEFGADNKALDHLATKSRILGEEITALEMELRESAVRSGELAVTASAQPNGVTLQLGTLGLVLVESSWGWLGRDDQLLFPMVQEVEIHEQIQAQLEQMLVPVPPRAAHNLDDDGPSTSERPDSAGEEGTSGKRGHAPVLLAEGQVSKSGKHFDEGSEDALHVQVALPPVKAVLCVSTCPLLPHASTLQTSDGDLSKTAAGKPITLRSVDTTAPGGFTLSSLDVRRVLQVLAKWQQESPDRAVLLSGPAPSNVDSAVGYAYPFVVTHTGEEITSDAQFDDPDNVMLDIWNKDRSRLHQILVGDLSRANRASVAYFQDLALLQALSKNATEAQLAAFTVTDRSTQFKSYYDRDSQCTRRCFWDVCFSPQLPPSVAPESSTGVRAAPPAGFVTDCVTDGRRGQVQFALGPIIGGVTSTSANVLVQVMETAPLELMCVDQVTGAEYLCSRLAAAHRPCLFEFEHLLPNHAYDVILLTTVGVAAGPAHSSCVLWGSFTTQRSARAIVAAVESGAAQDRHVVSSLRLGSGGGASVGGTATVTDDGSQAHHGGRSGNHSSASVRLLLLGADKPSWRSKLPTAASHSALERQYVTRGVGLCQEVSNCLSQGWSGIDVVIHCGYAVDWGCCIERVLDLLTQAEVLQGLYTGALSTSNYAVRSNNLPRILAPAQSTTRPYSNSDYLAGSRNSHNVEMDTSQGVTAHALLLQALEALRGAYLAHWGSTAHTSAMLAHGNHYFLNSPAFDLLTLFHATSLRDLRRDLSPYCVQHLMEFLSELQLEYQQQLQCPAQSVFVPHNLGDGGVGAVDKGRGASTPYLKLMDGGAVAMFELQPNFAYLQDSLNRVGDHLISEEQVQALHNLLFPTIIGVVDGANKSTIRSFATSNLHTLVLLSPIPLLLDSDTHTEYSNLSTQQKGIRYPQREILHLLDTLAQWLEVSPVQREVLIITGGVATSFITTITTEHLHRLNSPLMSPKRSQHHLPLAAHSPHALDAPHSATDPHNLQEGSFASGASGGMGGVSHPLRLRQMCCGTVVGVREDSLPQSDGFIHSNTRRYKFVHRACSYGTGAEILENTGLTRPQTAATSGTAAAAEAARAADSYPQCGVVEIATMETRAVVHRHQQMQQSSHTGAHDQTVDTAHDSAVHTSATLKFLDQGGLRTYFQRGWPPMMGSLDAHSVHLGAGGASVMSLSLKGKSPQDIAYDGRSLLQHSRLADMSALYQVMQDLQPHLPYDVASMRPQQLEPFVADIKRAMDIVCKRERTSFEECHRLYLRHEVFPLPSSGGYNVEKCLLSCTQYIVQRMSPALRKICKIPSSSIVRFAWEHFEREANRIVKYSHDAAKDGAQQQGNVLAEFVAASIAGDAEYFIKVVRCCLELQILAEFMAYSRGLLDGAER